MRTEVPNAASGGAGFLYAARQLVSAPDDRLRPRPTTRGTHAAFSTPLVPEHGT